MTKINDGLTNQQRYARRHPERVKESQRKNAQRHLERVREACRKYPEMYRKAKREWKNRNPEKVKVHNLISANPKRYPLASTCAFCDHNERLEHAHLDYEDEGFNYVTACHQCNYWMGKEQT